MTVLILGLVLFLGVHSARIVAEPARRRFIAQRGEGTWKGLYTVASVAGLALIVWGWGLARAQPVLVWNPPVGTRHAASLLVLLAFVVLAAAYVPGNPIKARLHHPMVLGVKVWALAHLISNGFLHEIVLFGAFLVWAVLSFRAARARDRADGVTYPAGTAARGAVTVAVGIGLWALFAFWAHGFLFGVQPFG